VPGWYHLDDDDRIRLGSGSLKLGSDTFLGRSVRVAQFKFRLVLGPLDRDTYGAFLPDGPAFRELQEMIRFAVGLEFDFEVRLILRGRDVPELRLWRKEGSEIRLGWNSWLATRPLDRDPSDVVVSGSARARGPAPAAARAR
jgi:type VI secretion system protein ImpH